MGIMAGRHNRLRHGRVAQHVLMQREKSQQVSDAPGPSGHAEPYTFGARASPSSSSRRRWVSPT